MAIPQLKGFDCVDHDPIDEWVPSSNEDAHYALYLEIGPPDSEGANLFYVDVATPQAINEHNLGSRLKQRGIVVNPYSWDAVLAKVQEILARCEGDNWNQQSELLSKHFHWEYENYRGP